MRIPIILATLTLLLAAGCAAHGEDDSAFDCNKSLCGCPIERVVSVAMKFSDDESQPLAEANLICHDNGDYLGTVNPSGLLTLSVVGDATPGCGFLPRCQVAYLRKKDGSWGRPFWFARFVRGEDAAIGTDRIERVKGEPADSD